jgi:large subunit ribosomal protein L23
MDIYSTIIKPVVTEKSTIMQERGQYTFYINPSATKIEIEKAFKLMFGEKPTKIRVINEPKKIRLIGRNKVMTKRNCRKKAIIYAKSKKKIDINKFK